MGYSREGKLLAKEIDLPQTLLGAARQNQSTRKHHEIRMRRLSALKHDARRLRAESRIGVYPRAGDQNLKRFRSSERTQTKKPR
jgi:hypothetical protein